MRVEFSYSLYEKETSLASKLAMLGDVSFTVSGEGDIDLWLDHQFTKESIIAQT
jgi:hypothetical protein